MRRLLLVVALGFAAAALTLPFFTRAQATSIVTTDTVQSACVLGAANATCTVSMKGKTSSGFLVTAISSPTGITLTPEVSLDNTSWVASRFEDVTTTSAILTVPNASLAVGYTRGIVTSKGTRFVRVRASAWTSGSATIVVTATDTPSELVMGQYEVKGDGAYTAHTAGAFDGAHIDTQGRLAVRTDHWNPFVCRVNGQTTMVNMTCTPSLPGGASTYHYVTSAVLSNGPTAQTIKVIASTTTACGGSPTDVTSTVYLGVNSGAMLDFRTPIKIGQANSYLCCQGSGNTAASCTVTGYLAP